MSETTNGRRGRAPAVCSIPGCGKQSYTRGWCRAHYCRWKRHGDPLCGSTSRGAAQQFLHNVVFVYIGNDCLIWPFARDDKGYAKIGHNGRMQFVHRAVCENINGSPPTPQHQAAHSCGNGHNGCVAPTHLRWATRTENQSDRLRHGTHIRGERNGKAKLTEADVLQIRALNTSVSLKVIADMFSVNKSTISKIQLGRKWAWLEDINK